MDFVSSCPVRMYKTIWNVLLRNMQVSLPCFLNDIKQVHGKECPLLY